MILERVKEYILSNNLISRDERILVAFSGERIRWLFF